MSSIEEQVKGIVAEQLGVKEDEVTNDASFVDDLGADSLDTVELVMALEEEFETEIPDEEAEKITTVQQAIDFVTSSPEQRLRVPARCLCTAPFFFSTSRHPAVQHEATLSKRRVVITGMGIVSPVGSELEEAWSNVCEGVPGTRLIEDFDTSAFPTRIAGIVKEFRR